MQTCDVYVNVSKGELAKGSDLLENFGSENRLLICLEILRKGELQISEKERKIFAQMLTKEITSQVTDICVNPETKRPYPFTVIEKSIRSLHFSVNVNRKAKQQALELVKVLEKYMPIQRAQMKLKIDVSLNESTHFETLLNLIGCVVEKITPMDNLMRYICLINPGQFRAIDQLVLSLTGMKDSLKILYLKEIKDEEEVIS